MARMGPIIPCQQPLILIFSMHSIRSTARIIGMGPKIVTFWPTSTVQCLFKYQRKSWFDISYLLARLHFPSLSTNRENLKSKYNIVTVIRIVIIIFKRNTGNQERGILCQQKSLGDSMCFGFLTSPIRYLSNLTADLGKRTPPADFYGIALDQSALQLSKKFNLFLNFRRGLDEFPKTERWTM